MSSDSIVLCSGCGDVCFSTEALYSSDVWVLTHPQGYCLCQLCQAGQVFMVALNVCLNEFLQPVPVLPETGTLAAAWEMLGQGTCDRLVLVDLEQQPIGCVRLHDLIPHLLKAARQPTATPEGNPSLREVRLLVPAIVQPVTPVLGELPLVQFLPFLRSQPQAEYALTSLEGRFLGLFDHARLLTFLVNQLPNQVDPCSIASPATAQLPSPQSLLEVAANHLSAMNSEVIDEATNSQVMNNQAINSQVIAPSLEQSQSASQVPATRWVSRSTAHRPNPSAPGYHWPIDHSEQGRGSWQPAPNRVLESLSIDHSSLHLQNSSPTIEADPDEPSLKALLELLERLPLPLMLQTSSGQVLTQNSVWCQQVSEWLDPGWIQQEAAALLEPGSTGTPSTPNGQSETPHSPLRSPLKGDGWLRGNGQDWTALDGEAVGMSPSFCHRGSQPGSCVCTCSLKNGQEQVWQLVKIPIGSLAALASGHLPTSLTSPHSGTAGLISQFRLAALNPIAPIDGQRHPNDAPAEHSPAGHPPISAPPSELLWLILAQDVTEQQQLARELTAKNADLIQLNRLKDEFLACISHELRTPLTAVLGLSSLLKDQTLGELNQRQVHYAQLIYQSGRHLMTVVNDILDLTRMETGQLELVLEPVEIPAVCQHAFNQAKQLRLLEDKQGNHTEETCPLPSFALEVEPGLKELVADEIRLRQMLVHLLLNALKFTEPDQAIGLKVNHWGGWIAFTVWDQGIGIPADKQHLIFQKFQQLENPLTRRFEGTGLGLVLTQRLARLHGGDVTFISKEGQGSQFTILLPPSPPGEAGLGEPDFSTATLTQPPTAERVPVRSSHRRTSPLDELLIGSQRHIQNRLVLIVEAVPQFIETLSEQLTGLGYRVAIARSGTEAVEKARRLQPCIVFLNPVLPLLSGWDVLTLLKSNQSTRQIPVIVTSTQGDEEQAYSSQANGMLSLPVQPKALRQSLQRLVTDSQQPAPPRSTTLLTVLRLSPASWNAYYCQGDQEEEPERVDLNALLHAHHYRVLEADGLEQSELLARVWKPNVVVVDGTVEQAQQYFQQFARHSFLASLPLVTLDPETTQAANQTPGLMVFPYLATIDPRSTPETPEAAALLQVVQIAAGYAWRPSILALDVAALTNSLLEDSPRTSPAQETPLDAMARSQPGDRSQLDEEIQSEESLQADFRQETEWLQALTQYLQTAGFRAIVGRSWLEVLQQVESQSVDLLLLCWTELTPHPTTLQMLERLQTLHPIPPVLVLDHRCYGRSGEATELTPESLPGQLSQLTWQILPPSLPMSSLLSQIHQTIQSNQAGTAGKVYQE